MSCHHDDAIVSMRDEDRWKVDGQGPGEFLVACVVAGGWEGESIAERCHRPPRMCFSDRTVRCLLPDDAADSPSGEECS